MTEEFEEMLKEEPVIEFSGEVMIISDQAFLYSNLLEKGFLEFK